MGDRRGLFSAGGLRFAAAAIVVINGFFPAIWILFLSSRTGGSSPDFSNATRATPSCLANSARPAWLGWTVSA